MITPGVQYDNLGAITYFDGISALPVEFDWSMWFAAYDVTDVDSSTWSCDVPAVVITNAQIDGAFMRALIDVREVPKGTLVTLTNTIVAGLDVDTRHLRIKIKDL